MLNLKTEAELIALLEPNFAIDGAKFVTLRPKYNTAEVFNLTADKVNRLTYVVQFLER